MEGAYCVHANLADCPPARQSSHPPSATNIAEDRTTCTTPRGTPRTASSQGPSLQGGRSRDTIMPPTRAVRAGGRHDREDYFFLPRVLPGILVSCVFCCSGVASPCVWWSSLAAVEQPRTAQGRPSLGGSTDGRPIRCAPSEPQPTSVSHDGGRRRPTTHTCASPYPQGVRNRASHRDRRPGRRPGRSDRYPLAAPGLPWCIRPDALRGAGRPPPPGRRPPQHGDPRPCRRTGADQRQEGTRRDQVRCRCPCRRPPGLPAQGGQAPSRLVRRKGR